MLRAIDEVSNTKNASNLVINGFKTYTYTVLTEIKNQILNTIKPKNTVVKISRWYIEHMYFDYGMLTSTLAQEEWPNFPMGPPSQSFT